MLCYLCPPRRLCNRWHFSVCFFLSEQRNSLTYWWILFNFSHIIHICLSKSWLHFGDVNVTIAYFKATLAFMGPLPGRRSALSECNYLVFNSYTACFKTTCFFLWSLFIYHLSSFFLLPFIITLSFVIFFPLFVHVQELCNISV